MSHSPLRRPWRARHLFVSDNGLVPPECDQDPASNFFDVVNEFISDFFPENHLLYRLFYAPPACSYGRPVSDRSAGGWTASTGTDLYEMINEVTADDSDYIEAGSGDTTAEVRLSPIYNPTSPYGHTLRFRAQSFGGGSSPEKLDVDLVEGTTVIANAFINQAINRGSFQSYSYTLSPEEAGSIDDYGQLQIRFVVDHAERRREYSGIMGGVF